MTDPVFGNTHQYAKTSETPLTPQKPSEDDLESCSRKVETILRANPWMSPDQITRNTQQILRMNASAKVKRHQLIKLADRVNEAVLQQSACRTGCSYCCSMPTLIYLHEAERLAAVSGRPLKPIKPRSREASLAAALPLYGKPCPFLQDSRCSVYQERPIICRLHHSLNATPANCDCIVPTAERKGVAKYDPDFVEMPYHELALQTAPTEPWGAIQEFFPDV